MNSQNLKKVWLDKFSVVPQTLEKIQNVESVATAFNANIDAVLKIKGAKIVELAQNLGMDLLELEDIK